MSIAPKNPVAWGLIDHRPGTAAQVQGVLAQLGWEGTLKRFTYSKASKLPNFLRPKASLAGIDPAMSDRLDPPLPQIIISAGRRMAPVALYIKKNLSPSAMTVHLMDPGAIAKEFDLVAIPSHDLRPAAPNIINTLGAPHALTREKLAQARSDWQRTIEPLPSPRVAVLIGGDTDAGRLQMQDVNDLLARAREIAGDGTLLITTSPRTPSGIVSELPNILGASRHHLHHYGAPGQNPYAAYLAWADAVLVTGESVTMCSEACVTGKPVYLYETQKTMGKKHKTFAAMMMKDNHARMLQKYDPLWKTVRPFNEAENIAGEIRKRYMAHR